MSGTEFDPGWLRRHERFPTRINEQVVQCLTRFELAGSASVRVGIAHAEARKRRGHDQTNRKHGVHDRELSGSRQTSPAAYHAGRDISRPPRDHPLLDEKAYETASSAFVILAESEIQPSVVSIVNSDAM